MENRHISPMNLEQLPNVVWRGIISHLTSTKDLASLRETSKALSIQEDILDKLTAKAWLTIKDPQNDQAPWRQNSHVIKRISSLAITHHSCNLDVLMTCPTFLDLLTRAKRLRIEVLGQEGVLYSLLQICKGTLTWLSIDLSKIYSFDVGFGFNLQTSPGTLRALQTFCCGAAEISDEDHQNIILRKILENSPSLKKIIFPALNLECPSTVTTIRIIIEVLRNPDVSALRNLENLSIPINYQFDEEAINALKVLRNISSLTIEMNAFDTLIPVIGTQWATSLTDLRITEWDHEFLVTHPPFPFLPNLKKLTLVSKSHPNGLYYFHQEGFRGSLQILECLPACEDVSLRVTSLPNVLPTNLNPIPSYDKLRSLQVVQFPFPPDCVPHLDAMFPNLRKLDFFELSNSALLLVCEHLINLEELRVGSNISDFGITGITTRKNYNRLLRILEAGGSVDEFRKGSGHFIGSLSRLHTITIVSHKITDMAIIFGLAFCIGLKSIKIPRPVISNRGLIALSNVEGSVLENLELEVDGEETTLGIAYLKNKLPKCQVHTSPGRRLY